MGYFDNYKVKSDIFDLVKSVRFKKEFKKLHPDYFDPDGILVFCGPQGSGKTLSAVAYTIKLLQRYPKVILVSNIEIDPMYTDGHEVYQYTGIEDLSKYSNGYNGVIYLIDEIQIEFNSLESKEIDPAVITEIAQQRKQRKHIIGTSQVFNRIAKPFREQFKYAVICRNFFGYIQFNSLVKGEDAIVSDTGEVTTKSFKRFIWFHKKELYEAYNTYAKIIRTNRRDFHGRRSNYRGS